ncbi:MAG: lytic transglycosylase domain-containing protein [Oligoflexia bacterium]|nr:lytic transglycosylase domain-containing protein [Oligoflexia bacterium]
MKLVIFFLLIFSYSLNATTPDLNSEGCDDLTSHFPLSDQANELTGQVKEIIHLLNSGERKKAILEKQENVVFDIIENDQADDEPPMRVPGFSPVNKLKKVIEDEVKKQKAPFDADLVKAIMYHETTTGFYDIVLEPIDKNKSIRPMNVHSYYWAKFLEQKGYTRNDLKDEKINVEVGVALLIELWNRVENPTISKVATLYNFLGAEKVNDYGARVAKVYRRKPWKVRSRGQMGRVIKSL